MRENLDLEKLAADLFGGGGHPKAAGTEINDETKNVLFDVLLDSLMQ